MTSIILTSTVTVNPNTAWVFQHDKQSRINTYLKSVRQWLEKTNLNIILVENTGYNFDELNEEKIKYKDRFEVIVFDELKLSEASYIHNTCSKGRREIFAIDYAFNNSKIVKKSNFIIKITARFYIPEFETYLAEHDLNSYDCLVQNDPNRCEVVGSHITNFKSLFCKYLDNSCPKDHMETVWKNRASKYKKILRCKLFSIDKTQRGGVSQQYTSI